jgi:hypothetical protein
MVHADQEAASSYCLGATHDSEVQPTKLSPVLCSNGKTYAILGTSEGREGEDSSRVAIYLLVVVECLNR